MGVIAVAEAEFHVVADVCPVRAGVGVGAEQAGGLQRGLGGGPPGNARQAASERTEASLDLAAGCGLGRQDPFRRAASSSARVSVHPVRQVFRVPASSPGDWG